MTMLDGMRRHKAWLKWSLGLVCLTFVLFYVPSFMRNGGVAGIIGAQANDAVASVNGHDITAGEYRRIYAQQLQSLRQSYGGNIDEKMLQQLGIAQRILAQMVDEAAMVAEAERLGLRVTDAELAERIKRLPGFQQNGQFVGDAMYREILQMQRPPLRPAEFEEQMRRQLMAEKLQAALTSWVRVSDSDVETEYRRRNEKLKLDLAVFKADQYRSGIQPTDAEITAQFNGHTDLYKVPEKRRVRFLSLSADAMRDKMTVTPQEIEARYKESLQVYSTPEQVRASHILFKTDGKDEAAVKKQAEAVLARAKKGEDFPALAKKFSDDETNKDKGGDLDYFGRGTMAKEFEDAAFSLQPGQVSDLVKTVFGFHIIKVVDKKAATTRPLDEVRGQIADTIKREKAEQQISQIADEIGRDIKAPADLDKVAAARGLTVGDSGLFARDEPLAGMGVVPNVAAEAFSMQQGKVSAQLRTNQGVAFIALTEIKPAHAPTLDEVKDKVRDDVVRTKAVALAKAKAADMSQAAAKGNFAAAAKAAGVDVKSTEFVPRGTALPDIGVSTAVDDAVFKLQAGETSAPIAAENAVVVAHVKERQDIKPDGLKTEHDALRDELLQQHRQDFFAAYMAKAKTKMKIEYNDETIKTLLGS
jgi:peptidyl-prolyl cis-trans isomerase D